jgi:hypothetical protein
MIKLLYLLIALFFSLILNSQSKKNYKIKKGNTETLYNEEEGVYTTSIEYKSYEDKVKSDSGSLLEWRFDGIRQPISADWTSYRTKSLGNYLKKGERVERFNFNFLNGKLNGLQEVFMKTDRGFKNVWSMAIINSVIVGKHIIDKNNNWVGRDDWEAAYRVKTFKQGKKYNYSYGGGWFLKSFEENNYYDLEKLVKLFLEDFKAIDINAALFLASDENDMNNRFPSLNLWEIEDLKIDAAFSKLNGNTIAISYGINRDNEIIIRVDPKKWENASKVKKWYVIYHELGHDVLNLKHGQGGRMMFNFPTKEYTWEEFFMDRDSMFDYYLKNKYKDYENISFYLRL